MQHYFKNLNESVIGKKIKWQFSDYFTNTRKMSKKEIVGEIIQRYDDCIYCVDDNGQDHWLPLGLVLEGYATYKILEDEESEAKDAYVKELCGYMLNMSDEIDVLNEEIDMREEIISDYEDVFDVLLEIINQELDSYSYDVSSVRAALRKIRDIIWEESGI